MADAPIRLALAGCGIGAQHLEAYAALPELFAVTALVDRDPHRARDLVDRFAVPRTVADLDALWTGDEPPVEAVDICLPPMAHEAAIKSALDHGAHVLCEKPLLDSLARLDEIEARAARAGRLVMPIFQYRFGAALAALRHLIDAGLAGRPLLASVDVHWDRDDDYFAVPWRRTRDGAYGGVLAVHAIHFLDLLMEVMGPVRRVGARTGSPAFGLEVEDTTALWLEMESGALAALSATLGAAGNVSRLRFCFEHLTVESGTDPYAPTDGPWTFAARQPHRQPQVDAALAAFRAGPAADRPPGYVSQFASFHDAVRHGAPLAVTLDDARRAIDVLGAAYASAADGGRPVALPLPSDDPAYARWPGPHTEDAA